MSRLRPCPRLVVGSLTALATAALLLGACTGGGDSLSPGPGGDFRYVGATPRGHTIPLAQRKPAGRATAPYLDGTKVFTLHSLRGQVVVLSYWASWCDSCRTETPGLERAFIATRAQGVAFVGVDVKDERSGATSFVRQHGVTYPIVFDAIAKTALQLGRIPTLGLPSTVVIDRAGRVAAVYLGPLQQRDLQPVVTALAREK